MDEERVVRVLEEIRDLLREQGARQQAAVADQQRALEAYRRMLRRLVPGLAAAIGLVLLILLLLLWRLRGRLF